MDEATRSERLNAHWQRVQYALLAIRGSQAYALALENRYIKFDGWIRAISFFFATAAAGLIFTEGSPAAKIFTVVVAVLKTADVVVGFSRRAREYRSVYEQLTTLEYRYEGIAKDIAERIEPDRVRTRLDELDKEQERVALLRKHSNSRLLEDSMFDAQVSMGLSLAHVPEHVKKRAKKRWPLGIPPTLGQGLGSSEAVAARAGS